MVVAGIRASDMRLRLDYAGIAAREARSVEEGLRLLVAETPVGGSAYILPTYTAMIEVRKHLARLVPMAEVR